MTWDEIFSVVRGQAISVLPGTNADEVTPDVSLSDLGANSLDRMDIVVASQDSLGITVPAAAFADVSNVRQLVDLLYDYAASK